MDSIELHPIFQLHFMDSSVGICYSYWGLVLIWFIALFVLSIMECNILNNRESKVLTLWTCIWKIQWVLLNPHRQLQKNLLVCSLQGPCGPQKLSSVVKKIRKPRDHCSIRSGIRKITEYAPDKVSWGPHGPRICGWGLMGSIMVFPAPQDSYVLNRFYRPYALGRHIESS